MSKVSPKQLIANKQNAKLGGVKTEEGKAASKFNALKHGLLSREALLATEDRGELSELSRQLRVDLHPSGNFECLLVDRIVANTWRLRRLLHIEGAAMAYQRKEIDRFNLSGRSSSKEEGWERDRAMLFGEEMDKLIRYESTLERGIYRALHELQRLQSSRSGTPSPPPVAVDLSFEQSG
jgi:hypothetical protein